MRGIPWAILIAFAGGALSASVDQARLAGKYGSLPLVFEANQGQTDSQVKFLSRGDGYVLYLTDSEAVLKVSTGECTLSSRNLHPRPSCSSTAVKLKLEGVKSAARILPEDPLPGRSNYFIGNDPSKWHPNVANYGKIEYRDVYPGISLIYYGNQRQLEYDFVVAPGADPRQIRVAVIGNAQRRLEATGDLVLRVAGTELRFRRPAIYQESEGVRHPIGGGYRLRGRHEIEFAVDHYDRARPLVIDPILIYSTYLGGTAPTTGSATTDQSQAIAVDTLGNAYLVGYTNSATFLPTTSTNISEQKSLGGSVCTANPNGPNHANVFIAKLNTSGTQLVYATYLGGSGCDMGYGIAVDAFGFAYVTGQTTSADFPLVSPLASYSSSSSSSTEGFVAKLNLTGSALVYSTYLGGSNGDGGKGITVDSSFNAYVTGFTNSPNFPTVPSAKIASGSYAFASKLSASGSALIYSTVLVNLPGSASGNSIAVDSNGNAYITGFSGSGTQQSAFVTQLNASGSMGYTTSLPGTYNVGNGIAVDGSGNAYVTGRASPGSFTPTATLCTAPAAKSTGAVSNAFVAELSFTGAVMYSTYLCGSMTNQSMDTADAGMAITVDPLGDIYVAGLTQYADFLSSLASPPNQSPIQSTLLGTENAFVVELGTSSNERPVVFATFLGGSGTDSANGIAVDGAGSIYITGTTSSPTAVGAAGFPVAPNATVYQSKNLEGAGNNTAFVSKIGVNTATAKAVVNGASFVPAITAGGIATVFGTGFSTGALLASQIPLPMSLDGATATVTSSTGVNYPVPLFYISPTQINFQVPWELAPLQPATLTISSAIPVTIPITSLPAAPGIFTAGPAPAGGYPPGAVLNATLGTLAQPLGSFSGATPAAPGSTISIFCTGLGAVSTSATPPVGDGSVTPISPALSVLAPVTVMFGSTAGGGVALPATASFAGLAPGYVGLYQVNVVVPTNVAPSSALQLYLSVAATQPPAISNIVTIAVQ